MVQLNARSRPGVSQPAPHPLPRRGPDRHRRQVDRREGRRDRQIGHGRRRRRHRPSPRPAPSPRPWGSPTGTPPPAGRSTAAAAGAPAPARRHWRSSTPATACRPPTPAFSTVSAGRPGLEHPRQPQTDQKHHQRMAEDDAQHMRHRAPHAEIHARGQQHHVVRPRRDRGDEGKAQQGKEQIIGHGAFIARAARLIDCDLATFRIIFRNK